MAACIIGYLYYCLRFFLTESIDDLTARARVYAGRRCCASDCLLAAVDNDMSLAAEHMLHCFSEINGMDRKQKKAYIRSVNTFHFVICLTNSCLQGES